MGYMHRFKVQLFVQVTKITCIILGLNDVQIVSGHLKEYKQMYEMILEGEKHVQQAKEDLVTTKHSFCIASAF